MEKQKQNKKHEKKLIRMAARKCFKLLIEEKENKNDK